MLEVESATDLHNTDKHGTNDVCLRIYIMCMCCRANLEIESATDLHTTDKHNVQMMYTYVYTRCARVDAQI